MKQIGGTTRPTATMRWLWRSRPHRLSSECQVRRCRRRHARDLARKKLVGNGSCGETRSGLSLVSASACLRALSSSSSRKSSGKAREIDGLSAAMARPRTARVAVCSERCRPSRRLGRIRSMPEVCDDYWVGHSQGGLHGPPSTIPNFRRSANIGWPYLRLVRGRYQSGEVESTGSSQNAATGECGPCSTRLRNVMLSRYKGP